MAESTEIWKTGYQINVENKHSDFLNAGYFRNFSALKIYL